MEYLVDILKITLPALLVLWAAYSTMTRFLAREAPTKDDKSKLELHLKAYERLTLFLERISPEKLIQRSQGTHMTCAELQISLLKMIRQEYEHNLTQQLYVSDEAWNSVVIAKESINQLINTSMTAVAADAPSIELAQRIIETYQSTKTTPIELSVRLLKNEVVALIG